MGSFKQGVASELEKLSQFQPEVTHAVVFNSTRWHPVQPPPGSEWDYEPFFDEAMAREALADVRQGESDHELWARSGKQWQQVA